MGSKKCTDITKKITHVLKKEVDKIKSSSNYYYFTKREG